MTNRIEEMSFRLGLLASIIAGGVEVDGACHEVDETSSMGEVLEGTGLHQPSQILGTACDLEVA